MYISELKIHGFKSFANKEVMKLGEGITTVVGPNGCGKTNIVDAIRWVLGEQKYSILRSGKMEDVIFNGAESLKPLGVCEVALTVHNNAGKLPVEYNDIEIARRVYRNGESEYYLNRTLCRLKDINDLFVEPATSSVVPNALLMSRQPPDFLAVVPEVSITSAQTVHESLGSTFATPICPVFALPASIIPLLTPKPVVHCTPYSWPSPLLSRSVETDKSTA